MKMKMLFGFLAISVTLSHPVHTQADLNKDVFVKFIKQTSHLKCNWAISKMDSKNFWWCTLDLNSAIDVSEDTYQREVYFGIHYNAKRQFANKFQEWGAAYDQEKDTGPSDIGIAINYHKKTFLYRLNMDQVTEWIKANNKIKDIYEIIDANMCDLQTKKCGSL